MSDAVARELAAAAGRYAVQEIRKPSKRLTREQMDATAYWCARIAWRWALHVKES